MKTDEDPIDADPITDPDPIPDPVPVSTPRPFLQHEIDLLLPMLSRLHSALSDAQASNGVLSDVLSTFQSSGPGTFLGAVTIQGIFSIIISTDRVKYAISPLGISLYYESKFDRLSFSWIPLTLAYVAVAQDVDSIIDLISSLLFVSE